MSIAAPTSWASKGVSDLPQQTELHRHLDVSIRTTTLLALAQERGLEAQSTSLEAFREKLILRKPMKDLNSVLAKFQLFQHVLDRPEVLEQVAYEVLEDCWIEGTRQVELRFSPNFVCEQSHLKWEDALDGFEKGIQKALLDYPEMRTGLICIASRDYGPAEVLRTVEFFLKHRDRLIGIDLAGPETDFPPRLFQAAFKKAIDTGAHITIHAGEATGPESIWEAIELLGARRIGHGITCVKDSKLMEFLEKKEICLEMCPTSNWLTHCVEHLEHHPLIQVLRSGIRVCINTDDPGMFGVTLPSEIQLCREKMGLSAQEVQLCMAHAANSVFL